MKAQPRPRIEVFSDIADFRQARGKCHPLSAMLALACCAMMCGDRGDSAIAAWGRHDGTELQKKAMASPFKTLTVFSLRSSALATLTLLRATKAARYAPSHN